jgi:hypothetical protein
MGPRPWGFLLRHPRFQCVGHMFWLISSRCPYFTSCKCATRAGNAYMILCTERLLAPYNSAPGMERSGTRLRAKALVTLRPHCSRRQQPMVRLGACVIMTAATNAELYRLCPTRSFRARFHCRPFLIHSRRPVRFLHQSCGGVSIARGSTRPPQQQMRAGWEYGTRGRSPRRRSCGKASRARRQIYSSVVPPGWIAAGLCHRPHGSATVRAIVGHTATEKQGLQWPMSSTGRL